MYRFDDFTTEQNSPGEAAILEDIGSILTAGGGEVTIVPEIQRKKFAKNFWNVAFSSFSTLTRSVSKFHPRESDTKEYISYTLPALFRPPPPGPSVSYAPFVSPTTADRIATYTIPSIRAMMEELVTLGMINFYFFTVILQPDIFGCPVFACRSRSRISGFTLWSAVLDC